MAITSFILSSNLNIFDIFLKKVYCLGYMLPGRSGKDMSLILQAEFFVFGGCRRVIGEHIDAQDAKKAIDPQLSPRGKITVLEMTGQAGWEFSIYYMIGWRAAEGYLS